MTQGLIVGFWLQVLKTYKSKLYNKNMAFFKECDKPFKMTNFADKKRETKQRNVLAPKTPCRVLICGQTGSGKTNLLLNLIYDLLPWTRLYLYAKNLHEHKYRQLQECCEAAEEKAGEQFSCFESDDSAIVPVDELDSREHNLIIFDDFLTDRGAHDKILDLFIRGRKNNATVIYLTQSYFDTPKSIRLQCNYLCFFKYSDERDLSELHRNHSCGMSKGDFLQLFHEATREPKHSFLMLDLETEKPELRLRKNFSHTLKVDGED